jgi:hypothetical protein
MESMCQNHSTDAGRARAKGLVLRGRMIDVFTPLKEKGERGGYAVNTSREQRTIDILPWGFR